MKKSYSKSLAILIIGSIALLMSTLSFAKDYSSMSDSELDKRLSYLDQSFEEIRNPYKYWQYGWTGFYAASAAAQTAKALDADGVKIAIEPDIFTYNSCLDGWMRGNSVNHATNAEKLLEKMALGRTANGVVPDRISYNTVIAAWAKAGRRNAWYRNSSKLGDENHLAKRAEAILYKMDASGIRPDTTSFNTCISAWSRSGQGKKAADRAEALLLAMEQLSEEGGSAEDEGSLVCPDGRTYSAVIEAIANSGDHDAPYRAQKVIERMKRISKKPNIFAFNSARVATAATVAPAAPTMRRRWSS